MERSKIHLSQNKEQRSIHAKFCEEKFERIMQCTSDIGMVINAEKTQLLCVSDLRYCNTKSYFIANGSRVNSLETMKILGFVFDERPNVNAHINYCINKFNKALWALTHLKRAKIDTKILVEVFKIMLRPHLEYCAPVYNSMLTQEMNASLEKQQRRALNIIFGFGLSYEDLLLKAGLTTLESRREEMSGNFAKKLVESERFSSLFPLNEYTEDMAETRNRKTYREDFARSNRLFNSPLYSMRRYLNQNY